LCTFTKKVLRFVAAQVGYGNAPTVPSERSGVALTEDQRKLFTLPGKIHDTLQLNPKDPRLLG